MEWQCAIMERAWTPADVSVHPLLYTESLGNGVDGWSPGSHPLPFLFAFPLTPPTYFISITVYFNLFTLVTKIANSGQLVWDWISQSATLGPRFLIYEMRCWNRWFHTSLWAFWLYEREFIVLKIHSLESFDFRGSKEEQVLLCIQQVTALDVSSVAFFCVQMAREKRHGVFINLWLMGH